MIEHVHRYSVTTSITRHSGVIDITSALLNMASLLAPSPLLSPNEAHLVAFSLTSAYVGGLYLSRLSLSHQNVQPKATGSAASKKKDETPLRDLVEADTPIELDRDDPRVIRSRCKAVGVATLGGCALVGGIIYYRGKVQDLRATVSLNSRTSMFSPSAEMSFDVFISYLSP
jgi:hypothetical protein